MHSLWETVRLGLAFLGLVDVLELLHYLASALWARRRTAPMARRIRS